MAKKEKRNRNHRQITSKKSSSTISLCMIVKNEEAFLSPCLESIKNAVDEIIIVDTGSTDNTRDIARQMGAKVFEFPWTNDFSAARNESIRRATGHYILWLDADDRIDPEEIEKLSQIKSQLSPYRPRAYYFIIQSHALQEGVSSFYQMRLFPKKPGVLFEGRVHEQVVFSLQRLRIPFEYLPIRIRHTGYNDPTTIKRKFERNWAILEADIEKNPNDLFSRYYGARTLGGQGRYQEAIEHIQKITENPTIQKKEKTFYLQSATLLGQFYLKLNLFSEAKLLFQKLVIEHPDDPMVQYELGESHFLAGDYESACIPLRRSLELPLELSIFPVNQEQFVYGQFHALCQCYKHLGMREQAGMVWEAYLARDPDNSKPLELLGLLALEDNRFSEAVDYFQRADQKGAASDIIFSNLGLCLRKLERWAEAEEALRQALKLNPDRLEALINLGLVFYQQKKHHQALDYFNQALALDHQLVDVRLFISDIFLQAGEVEGLVKVCDELLELLYLDRDLTIQSLQDLGELFFQIAGALDQGGKPTLAIQALHVGFSLHPTQEMMEQIVAKAKEIGNLATTLQRLEDDLSALKKASPTTLTPNFLSAAAR